jgi:hydrogenase/urease accessory protein HupE
MIQNKTRIRLTWYSAFVIPIIIALAIHKGMNDVASAGILAFTGIIGGYIAGKTINNQAHIKNGTTTEK